jgi:hypothetical protein
MFDEGYVTTPISHIASRGGSISVSVQQVMVPVSPQKEHVVPFVPIVDFSCVHCDGYDADADDVDLGTIHYLKAPHTKHYPNAVSLMHLAIYFPIST